MQLHWEFHPPDPCRAKNSLSDKAQFLKDGKRRILMNHNHWPEWIRVLRDDIFPRGFLTRPSSRRTQHVRVRCGRQKEASVSKTPSFSWRRDAGLHNRRGLCCGAALSPGHLPPPAWWSASCWDDTWPPPGPSGGKQAGMSGETRREMMSNAHVLWGKEKTKLQDCSLFEGKHNAVKWAGWVRIKQNKERLSELKWIKDVRQKCVYLFFWTLCEFPRTVLRENTKTLTTCNHLFLTPWLACDRGHVPITARATVLPMEQTTDEGVWTDTKTPCFLRQGI